MLTAGPAAIAAFAMIAQRPQIYFDGDQAVDELALIRAGHLEQLVGNYSRYGWSHPGPAWFYSLDVFYGPLGGYSWALVAANLLINAIVMALIVFVVWRARGPVLAALSGGVVLAYVAVMGEQPFRDAWPPYALIAPMLLFFLLSAVAAAGSTPAQIGALIAGSYLAQLHVGTVPTVAAVTVGAIALRIARDRVSGGRASEAGLRSPRRRWDRWLIGIGAGVLVLMWIPPAIDEVTGHPGNLTLLWRFFTTAYPKHGYLEAASAFGRLLTPLEWRRLDMLQVSNVARVSPAFIAVAAVFTGMSAGLAVAGTILRDRFAQSIGALVVVAALAIEVSIRDVAGPVYAYLLLWVTCLPVVLVIGCIALLPRLRIHWDWHIPSLMNARGVVALAATLAALSVTCGAGFLSLPPTPSAAPDTRAAWAYTSAALDREPKGPVLLDMYTSDTWVVAAGVALQLVKDGHPVEVSDQWVFMFGRQARATGSEAIVLHFVDRADSEQFQAAYPNAVLVGATDAHSIFLTRT